MKKFKGVYFIAAAVFAFMLHMPVAFSGLRSSGDRFQDNESHFTINKSLTEFAAVYDSLHLSEAGLSREAYDAAVTGLEKLNEQGRIRNENIVSIADLSKPSTEKRLFVIDLDAHKLLFKTYVAHGKGSGSLMAEKFSNVPESFTSSAGFYRTASTYTGKHGYSLQLEGLEKGINDAAYSRAIVMHGAEYVSENFVNAHGYLGRSQGCPAVPSALSKPIIEKIKNGTCLFLYSKQGGYLSRSKILQA